MFTVRNQTQNKSVAHHVERAVKLLSRMKGLLGRKELPDDHGLWIERCNSIHTFFMNFAIDVVFISKDDRVIRTYENLQPFRVTRCVRGASRVLELPAGSIKGRAIHVGDRLTLESAR